MSFDDIPGECSECGRDIGEGVVGMCAECFERKYHFKPGKGGPDF